MMDELVCIRRFVTYIMCGSMVLVTDPMSSGCTDPFWSKNTYLITICYICETMNGLEVTIGVSVYKEPASCQSVFASSRMVLDSKEFKTAHDIIGTRLTLCKFSDKVAVFNRIELLHTLSSGAGVSSVMKDIYIPPAESVCSYISTIFFQTWGSPRKRRNSWRQLKRRK